MAQLSYNFISSLVRFPFIEEVWLFGSRARGDHTERSDIDLSIYCPLASESDWQEVMEIIETADTLLKVDCVRFDALDEKDRLRENISQFHIVLYNKKEGYVSKLLWQDYFFSLGDAVKRLEEVLSHKDINNIEYLRDASIQRFEFCIELYWKVLRKFLGYEKIEAQTPREVLRKSFQYKLIDDEKLWLSMLDDRNRTSHVYKEEDAKQIFERIKTYFPTIGKTYARLKKRFEEM